MKRAGFETRPPGAFTLIELLVVIAIIGILAGLIVGVSGVASSRKKVASVQSAMRKVETAIESYKASLGYYPPGALTPDGLAANTVTNQLYYELTGTWFGQSDRGIVYRSGQGGGALRQLDCRRFFGVDGFQNQAPRRDGVRSFIELNDREVATLGGAPQVSVLAAPVTWPATPVPGRDQAGRELETYRPVRGASDRLEIVNPWQYLSTRQAVHNKRSFDLWALVPAGGQLYRVDNWNREPKALNQ